MVNKNLPLARASTDELREDIVKYYLISQGIYSERYLEGHKLSKGQIDRYIEEINDDGKRIHSNKKSIAQAI